jgi:hypothetical protein
MPNYSLSQVRRSRQDSPQRATQPRSSATLSVPAAYLVLCLVVSACGPLPDSSETADSNLAQTVPAGDKGGFGQQSARPTATPRARSRIKVIRGGTPNRITPQPSPTDWPAPVGLSSATPGPAFVIMDLQDGLATAHTWSIPQQEPTVERSGYIAATDAIEALRTAAPAREGLLLWGGNDGYLESWLLEYGGPVLMVELSQVGMDVLGVGGHFSANATPEPHRAGGSLGFRPGCIPVPRNQRYKLTAYIDPRNGHYVGHSFGTNADPIWDIADANIDIIKVTPTPRPSATASPASATVWPTVTPHPTPKPLLDPLATTALGVGEYPAGIHEMIQVWPLVAGSSWTYRATGHSDGREWHSEVVTETVISTRSFGADAMIVTYGVTHSLGTVGKDYPWASGIFSHERIVLDDRVMSSLPGSTTLASLEELLGQADNSDRSSPSASTMARLPLVIDDPYNYWWRTGRIQTVTGPAGVFPGSVELTAIRNAANSSGHWLTPGVGIVRHELPGCSSGSAWGNYTVLELIEWQIPPLKAVSSGTTD